MQSNADVTCAVRSCGDACTEVLDKSHAVTTRGCAILASLSLSVGVPPADSVGAYGLPAFFWASCAKSFASEADEVKKPLHATLTHNVWLNLSHALIIPLPIK